MKYHILKSYLILLMCTSKHIYLHTAQLEIRNFKVVRSFFIFLNKIDVSHAYSIDISEMELSCNHWCLLGNGYLSNSMR